MACMFVSSENGPFPSRCLLVSHDRYDINLAALCRWITMAQDVNITVLPPTGDEPDGSSKFTAIFSLQRLLDPTERHTSSSYCTPHAVQAGAFWPIYMAAHLYLPTYKAEESGRLLWNGRPPGLVGFKARDDDTGEDATGLRIPGSYNNCSTWTRRGAHNTLSGSGCTGRTLIDNCDTLSRLAGTSR